MNRQLQFDFPVAGAEVTLLQPNVTNAGVTPIGRIVTQEGTNTVPLFNTPNLQAPIEYAITLDDAATVKISALTEQP